MEFIAHLFHAKTNAQHTTVPWLYAALAHFTTENNFITSFMLGPHDIRFI